ncbi:MAG: IclR family transcriptional regulator [Dehalococcoidia bacterium]
MLKDRVETEQESISFKSIHRVARILRCLSEGLNTVTEISSECNLNKSTVYRLLRTGEKAGLFIRDPFKRRYFLGTLITEIASNPYVPHEQLVLCAIREMTGISEYTRESIGLHVLTGFYNMLLVYEIPGKHDLQFVAKDRLHTHLHTGGTCKVLLSQLKGRMLDKLINQLDFTPITPYSIKDREQLKSELKQVKRQGFGIDMNEKVEGMMCLSAPIRNYVLPAAFSVLGPISRIEPDMDDYIEKLHTSRMKIERNLSQVFEPHSYFNQVTV